MKQVGSYAKNLREGKRSEYLAQYFFSSLGTAVPIPNPEDTGLDLHCTIAEVVGRRAWPRCFYSVQVKSEMKPWVIESTESVRWLTDQPFPIFLCVVEKSVGRFRLYQTIPRHLLRTSRRLPNKIELVPEEQTDGWPTTWEPWMKSLSLSAPILDFNLDMFLDDSFISSAKSIISEWVFWDNHNIHMRNSGMQVALMPSDYKTNEQLKPSGTSRIGLIAQGEGIKPALNNLSHNLIWIASCLTQTKGGQGLAVRMALLLRRLDTEYAADCVIDLHSLLRDLCLHFGLPEPVDLDSFVAGLDLIDALIEENLPDAWKGVVLVQPSKLRSNLGKPK